MSCLKISERREASAKMCLREEQKNGNEKIGKDEQKQIQNTCN